MLTSGEGGGERNRLGAAREGGGARSMQIYVQIQWLTNANSRYYTDDLWSSTNPASAQPSALNYLFRLCILKNMTRFVLECGFGKNL